MKSIRLVKKISVITTTLIVALCCYYSFPLYSSDQDPNSSPNISFLKGSYDKNPSYVKALIENYKYGYIDLQTMIQKTITDLYSPLINIKEKPSTFELTSSYSSSLNPGVDSSYFNLNVGNFEICDTDIVVHNHKDFNAPLIFGYLPVNPDIKFIPDISHFPDVTRTQAILQNRLNEVFFELKPRISTDKYCLYPDGNELVPALSFIATIDDKPYNIILNEREILHFKKMFFSVDGTATIFDKNRFGGLKTVGLSNLDGSGYLVDPHFYTTQPSRAFSSTFTYNFDPESDQFRETSTFKNLQDYYAWFQTLGYSWHDSKKINIISNAIIEGSPNNAFFSPSTASSEDHSISVGTGDGTVLKDLAIDRDVVNHEFGHFIIYATLKNADERSQALVIHEGVADFFVMMRNQSPCLAPSVCPPGSSLCSGSCLRTASNSMTLQTAPQEAHQRSVFLSGMLWDLYQVDSIPHQDLLAIVFRALPLLGVSSGYRDFIASMLVSDLANFNMKYCSKILNRAEVRGLSAYTKDLQCDKNAISNYTADNSNTGANGAYSSNGKSHSFCGTIVPLSNSDGSNPPSGTLPVSLMVLIPLLICLFFILRKEEKSYNTNF